MAEPDRETPPMANILVVDDHPANLLAIEAVLEPLGHRVVRATSGREALELLLHGDFAVILLDVQMPGLDGFQTAVLVRQRERTREVPILFLTAIHHDEFHVKQGYTHGAADYIMKPFDPDVLRAKVRVFVDLWNQRERLRRRSELREREHADLTVQTRIARADADVYRARYHSLLTQATVPIAIHRGPDHMYEFANGPYRALFGGRDLVGRVAREMLPDLIEQGIVDVLDRVYATGQAFVAEELPMHVEREAGTRGLGYFRFSIEPTRNAEAQIDGLLAIGIDVTDQVLARQQLELLHTEIREREERLRLALEAADVGTWRYELASDQTASDVGLNRLLGLPARASVSPREVLLGRVHPGDRPRVERAMTVALEACDGFDVECRVRRADKALRWVRTRGKVLMRGADVPVALTGIVSDVTEVKRLEAEREQLLVREQQARREAETANRLKDEFLATVSHELRTPLTAILGWTSILRNDNLPPAQRARALETVERNARAQTRLIEDLLDVSRIIAGKLRLHVGPADLRREVEQAADVVGPAASAKGVRLDVEVGNAPITVTGDAERLRQVAWNLLSNAVKFTPRGGTVTVRVQRDGPRATLIVQDSGQGIDPAFLPHVFEPFRQADATATRTHGGLGLGLAIVHRLVELHGGTIAVHSEGHGHGARFEVALPLSLSQPVALETRRSRLTTEECPRDLAGLRVLVVDDEPDAREMVATALAHCHAVPTTAASAAEALDALARETPDVLISDLAMPGEDGYALIRKIRALPADKGGHTAALALSAYARAEDRARALAAGFDMHAAKPIAPEDLMRAVAEAAGR